MESEFYGLNKFLSKDLQNFQPDPDLIARFRENFRIYLQNLDQSIIQKESEEHQKNLFCNFLKDSFPEYKNINTHGRIDSLIRDKDHLPRVLIETKRISNSGEMLSEGNFNRKALHEALLYFHQLRQGSESFRLNYIMITDCEQIFLFSARQFDELCQNKKVASCLKAYAEKSSASIETTDKLYDQLKTILESEQELKLRGVFVNLREYDCKDEKQCRILWKFLSLYSLFREPLSNDANYLNERFYYELLHILGLKEKQEGGLEYNQDPYSMLGCTIEALKKRAKISPEDVFETAFELCIVWLNRILFLKILEALLIGFSAGKFPKFLDENKIKHLSDLGTLFFRVLAVKREERAELEQIFPFIPYLNSSLFEETETERLLSIDQIAMYHPMKVMGGSILKDKETQLPFLTYLIRFLNCYQFNKDAEFTNKNTVISSSVLGLVFEKLNGYRDGAHFTPARITMYMARRTIHRLILQKFNREFETGFQYFEQLQEWVRWKLDGRDEKSQKAEKILDSIRIFDPAVGSGHFLVSCLNELVRAKRDLCFVDDWYEYDVDIQNDELVITHANGDDFRYELRNGVINKKQQIIQKSLFETKLRIIENQLYGIDINPNSVNICRLRLWIELLKHTYYVDDQYIDLHILPNLEFKVMAANSIIRLPKGDVVDILYFDVLDELRISFNQYFEAGNEDKQKLRLNIQESLTKVKDMQVGTQRVQEKDIAQFDPFNLSISNPFFDSELMFGVKNFDIVIGNPPYIQLQSIPKEKNPYTQEDFKTYAAAGDIYQLFMERAFNWLSGDGVVSLIVSNKWMLSKYGQKTRGWLYHNAWVDELINLGEGWFAGATVDTNIIVYRRKDEKIPGQKEIPAGDNLDEAPGGVITPDGQGSQWIIVHNEEYEVLKKMRQYGKPLKEWDIEIYRGILTGFNEAFKIDKAKYDELVEADPKSAEILKPMLEGKDIRRWGYEWAEKYLVGTHNGIKSKNISAIDINDYPAVKEHLDIYWQKIEKREDQGDTPYNLRNCAYWEEFAEPKIVWGNLNLKPGFTLDTAEVYIFAPSNLLTLNTADLEMLKALLAILNSKASHYFLSSIAYTRNGGYQEHKPMFVEQIPIPEADQQVRKKLASLVEKILEKQKDNQDISGLEQEIDRIVYQLYHLTEKEIALIEEKS